MKKELQTQMKKNEPNASWKLKGDITNQSKKNILNLSLIKLNQGTTEQD